MDKITAIRDLLVTLGLPKKQQSDICVLTILGLAQLQQDTPWTEATNEWKRIHDIIGFVNANYNVDYKENSRETFRKQALHNFRTAAITEDNGIRIEHVRIVFDGTQSNVPFIANLVEETGLKVNILSANTRSVGGIGYGQMIIELPELAEDRQTVIDFFKKGGLSVSEVNRNE